MIREISVKVLDEPFANSDKMIRWPLDLEQQMMEAVHCSRAVDDTISLISRSFEHTEQNKIAFEYLRDEMMHPYMDVQMELIDVAKKRLKLDCSDDKLGFMQTIDSTNVRDIGFSLMLSTSRNEMLENVLFEHEENRQRELAKVVFPLPMEFYFMVMP